MDNLYFKLNTLSVFSGLNEDPVFRAFYRCLCDGDDMEKVSAVSNFAAMLYNFAHTDNWTEYLKDLVLASENACSYYAMRGEEIPPLIRAAASHDLALLSECVQVTAEQLLETGCRKDFFVPRWRTEFVDLGKVYFAKLAEIGKSGCGIFAKYRMFYVEASKVNGSGYEFLPVRCHDKVRLSDLVGYKAQQKKVVENTRALLCGSKASNVLLYGDAGTGKSATVKAMVNEYGEEGIRLVELSKGEIHLLPRLLDELSTNPLKFIVFIDDLSFQDDDEDFRALKAVLEGSICVRPANVAIYVTSNRCHIVRESFSQREGDEIHRNDTVQETISLADRFGMKVYFGRPSKDLYLEIVRELARENGIEMESAELEFRAERFALEKQGRSARAARQFVEQLCC